MAKSNRDHALQLLDMATRDQTALQNMLDPGDFAEEVFGFHAQQTVEKTLKAWISTLGLAYPKTHDLSALLKILRGAGAEVSGYDDLADFTVFAVQYRYDRFDPVDEPLNRVAVVDRTEHLISRVRSMVETP